MNKKGLKTTFLALSILLLSENALADAPLRSIIIFGNNKTERKTILSIINVEPRTYIDGKLLKTVDDRLNNCGLFKSVRVVPRGNPDGTEDLRITVVEKQLWFAAPIVSVGSGRYSFGAAFGESNLLFSNSGTLTALQLGNRMNRFFFALDSKNVFDSDFSFRGWVLGRKDFVPLYTGKLKTDEIIIKDAAISLSPGYQWTNEIRTSYAVSYRYIVYGDSPSVNLANTRGNDVTMAFEFLYDSLKRKNGFVQGNMIKAGYEFSGPRFGSDYRYNSESVEWTFGTDIAQYFNNVFYIKGNIGDTLPFHKELTLGNDSLRGFQEKEFRGDTEIFLRNDLLFPLFRHKWFTVFGDAFYDMGFLYFDQIGINRDSLHNGVGGGIRVSLSSILAPVFGLDYGYGIEDHSYSMILALGLVTF